MNTESQILQVPIEDIIPNRFQPRLNFDDSSLQELTASIKEHGIIQPLVLRRVGDKYEIIAGERRYKAATQAGLVKVPAIINQLDDKNSAEVAIVENIQRKDLSSIEEARSYKALLDKGYLTQEELAKRMGVSQSAISNKLRLLSLAPEVQQALMENKISERHARSLLQITDNEEQVKWLNKIINERLTVRDLEKKLKGQKEEEGPIININPNMEDIINSAKDILNQNNKPTNTMSSDIDNQKNKFFNVLESESANMTTIEEPQEEIELLDFSVPNIPSKYTDSINELRNTLNELNLKNNNITFKELDLGKEIHFTIIIKDK